MLRRPHDFDTVHKLLRDHPVVGVIGARQVGKTTLARMLADAWKSPTTFFDLENPEDLARLAVPVAKKDPSGCVGTPVGGRQATVT